VKNRFQNLPFKCNLQRYTVATAARALIGLFRELAPGMLEKKDRGKGAFSLPSHVPASRLGRGRTHPHIILIFNDLTTKLFCLFFISFHNFWSPRLAGG
jgi:hypothetical protein